MILDMCGIQNDARASLKNTVRNEERVDIGAIVGAINTDQWIWKARRSTGLTFMERASRSLHISSCKIHDRTRHADAHVEYICWRFHDQD